MTDKRAQSEQVGGDIEVSQTVKVNIGGTVHVMTNEQARKLWQALNEIYREKISAPLIREPIIPQNPWTIPPYQPNAPVSTPPNITCGADNGQK